MREIKFRGWNPERNKWVYGGFFRFPDGDCRIVEDYEPGGDKVGVVTIPVAEDSVGQFTGLHDTNGKKIYEGDILKSDKDGHLLTVVWSILDAHYEARQFQGTDYGAIHLNGFEAASRKVVGNVYEMSDWKIND